MKIKHALICAALFFSAVFESNGQGISVDAGITPAQNRIILRSQFRSMTMSNAMMTTNTQMFPVVFAYGLRPGITVMARNMYVRSLSSNNEEVKSGFNDPFLLAKFRLYRLNTANFVFGVAPHIASNIPVGNTLISNRTWSPELGLNISFRPRFFSFDFSTSYVISDITGKMAPGEGDIFNWNGAFAAIVPLNENASTVLAPVAEINYQRSGISPGPESVGRDLFMLSPGLSLIASSLVLELLYQVPVLQTSIAGGMKHHPRFITGIKYMF